MTTKSDKPLVVIQDLGNGRFYYHYNRVKKFETDEDEKKHAVYYADTVKVIGEPNYAKLITAVIREEYSQDEEIALINNYLESDASQEHRAEYITYTERRNAIKAMVLADLASLNV